MSRNLLFLIILLVGCLTQFASDIYAPAVPAISHALNAKLGLVQWSMAIYMLGVALSQIVYGVVSEGVGRKNPLLIGLGIMFVGTLLCISATSIHMLIIGRLLQGCGAGACAAMWRSIFRDVFSGEELAKYGSYLTAFIVFIIPLAPAIGGYLTHYFTWRSTFIFLVLYTIVALLFVLYGYRETSQHHHPERLKLSFIKATFAELFRSRVFIGSALTSFMAYGGLFAWITSAPVLLMHIGGMGSVAFGWFLFLGGGGAYAAAGFLNGKFVQHFGIPKMMRFGCLMMFLSGMILFVTYLSIGFQLWITCATMVLFYFGATFIFPNTNAKALTPFGKIAGYAGSLYGLILVGGAAILGGLVSYLPESSPIPIAVTAFSAAILAWIAYELVVHRKSSI